MIIYGSRATQLAHETLSERCPHCGLDHTTQLYVFQRYAHVFWIPLFPIGKIAVTSCSNCKKVSKQKEMTDSVRMSSDNLKSQSKTPIWTFAGVALIAVLIIIGIIDEKKKDARNAALILSPKNGDVFEVKTKKNQYTLFKVENVQGDSIFLRLNNYETNVISGLDDLRKKGEAAYSEDLYAIHKNDLKQMVEKGEIIDIDRN